MVPLINLVAGIVIGITSDLWFSRLVLPILWGIAFYGVRWVLARRQHRPFLPSIHLKGRKQGLSATPWFQSYYVQFLRGIGTSMAFSVMTGLLMDLLVSGH
jgi:hypothetical protein